jgi:peptidoglycan/LPS O-acetylase OafA/YrhL
MSLTKTECSALRGIAILGIVMHNFLHWLRPMVKENEYQFHQNNIDGMMGVLSRLDWDIPIQLFSFFGHYGVPVFLFLSGYGLVKKYESGPAVPGGFNEALLFVWHHFKKLFPMMLLGFVVFAMIDWMTPGRHHWSAFDIIAQLTMTINFFPEPDHHIWPGPYWFFGLMMQLYIIYRFILYRRHWGYAAVLIALCWALQALCFDAPEGETLNRIRYNAIGGILPFSMGILLARYEGKLSTLSPKLSTVNYQLSTITAVASAALIFLFSTSFQLWLWVPALVVILHVSLVKILPTLCLKAFDWVGVLSAALFVAHPIARKLFIPISRQGDIMGGLLLYLLASVVLAMLFKRILAK